MKFYLGLLVLVVALMLVLIQAGARPWLWDLNDSRPTPCEPASGGGGIIGPSQKQ